MNTNKKPIPPAPDVIREDSGPAITDIKEPKKNPASVEVNIDDAQIDEPKDDAFKKSARPDQAPKRRHKSPTVTAYPGRG